MTEDPTIEKVRLILLASFRGAFVPGLPRHIVDIVREDIRIREMKRYPVLEIATEEVRDALDQRFLVPLEERLKPGWMQDTARALQKKSQERNELCPPQ